MNVSARISMYFGEQALERTWVTYCLGTPSTQNDYFYDFSSLESRRSERSFQPRTGDVRGDMHQTKLRTPHIYDNLPTTLVKKHASWQRDILETHLWAIRTAILGFTI